jgi:hypothetical protein
VRIDIVAGEDVREVVNELQDCDLILCFLLTDGLVGFDLRADTRERRIGISHVIMTWTIWAQKTGHWCDFFWDISTAFSTNFFAFWVFRRANSPLESTLQRDLYTTQRVGKKSFRILTTPKLHSIAVDRWGTEHFLGDVSKPSGVELEDGGEVRAPPVHISRVFILRN